MWQPTGNNMEHMLLLHAYIENTLYNLSLYGIRTIITWQQIGNGVEYMLLQRAYIENMLYNRSRYGISLEQNVNNGAHT